MSVSCRLGSDVRSVTQIAQKTRAAARRQHFLGFDRYQVPVINLMADAEVSLWTTQGHLGEFHFQCVKLEQRGPFADLQIEPYNAYEWATAWF